MGERRSMMARWEMCASSEPGDNEGCKIYALYNICQIFLFLNLSTKIKSTFFNFMQIIFVAMLNILSLVLMYSHRYMKD